MIKETVETTLSVAGKLAGSVANAIERTQSGSLIEFTKSTRVEPIVMLEGSLREQPFVTDVLQTLTSLFSAYYLQAVALTTTVNGVSVLRTLDRLATERDAGKNFLQGIGAEAYAHGLPNYDTKTVGTVSLENLVSKEERSQTGFGDLADVPNLAIGKLLEVKLGVGKDNSVTIPMAVRLNVKTVSSDSLVHILTVGVKDNSTKARFHRWRSGELDFIRDLILCQDLIDEKRKGMLTDKTGLIERQARRDEKNKFSALFSGESSINAASGLVVLSANTAKKIEGELSAKLSKFKKREELFREAFIMLMVVVDPEWERVTIYHRSIEDATELSLKDLKNVNKRSGPDVLELLKAFQAGTAPQL